MPACGNGEAIRKIQSNSFATSAENSHDEASSHTLTNQQSPINHLNTYSIAHGA